MVGVVSPGGASLSLPSFVTPQFKEFFRLGRVLRTTLPTGKGGVVHLFVVYGYQGAEGDADQLLLTDELLQAVLAEAQVVCVGQPVLIASDLNADLAVITCLAEGISAGRFVDLALAYSLGAGVAPDVTCRFSREDGTDSRRDFFVGCPSALAASHACYVTSHLISLLLLTSVLMLGWLMLLARLFVSLFGLLVGWTLLIGHPRRPLVLSRMSVMLKWTSLGWFLVRWCLLLGMLSLGHLLMIFGLFGVGSAEAGLFRAYSKAGGPTEAGSAAFLGRGVLRIRNRRLGGRAVGSRGSSRFFRASQGDEVDVHCAQYFVNSSLAPVVLFRRRLKSVADVLKKVFGVRVLLSLGGMLFWVTGRLCVVMVRVVLSHHFVPGTSGFSLNYMVSISGFLIP